MIYFLHRQQLHHLEPVLKELNQEYILDDEWSQERIGEMRPDLLVTFSDDWFESYNCIKKAKDLNIPTLLLMDGILEWRHQWDNPRWGSGGGIPYKQPIECDKIACIGRQSARVLETWGNAGKCEVTGVPRFDRLREMKKHLTGKGPRRILVMTAHTPGFTREQTEITLKSLQDIKDIAGRRKDIEIIWRVTRGLHETLGIENRLDDWGGKDLPAILQQVDAVITTSSTAMLEAMLMDVPVSLLDYHNTPHYVPAAWNIYCNAHIENTIDEMIQRPARLMALQDDILHDCLECHGPAVQRTVRLIETMAEIGQKARDHNQSLKFPSRILPLELNGHSMPSEHFDFAELYPDHPAFKNENVLQLQRRIIHLQQEVRYLKRRIKQSSFSSLLIRGLHRLAQ